MSPRVISLFALIYICITLDNLPALTLPLTHMKLSKQDALKYYQFNQHHLRHSTSEDGTETYLLHSLKNIFALNLIVNGLPYNLSVDTGSSDLFIKGEDLEGSPQRKFSCKKCITDNQYLRIGYLDGRLDTYIHNSTIVLGNHEFKQSILVAYGCDNINNFLEIGGIVGLSFQQKSRNPYPNFMNTLIKQKIISRYRFGLKLNFNQTETSYITFGGMDAQHIDPSWQMTYYDILEETFSYKLEIGKLNFGEKQFELKVALIDSGNTCVSIDEKYTDEMLGVLNVDGNECQFEVEKGNTIFKLLVCTIKSFQSLPVITLEMPDGKNYSFEKQYYLDTCYILSKDDEPPKYKCNTYIESVKHRSNGLFLGAAWLLKYYAVFDLDDRKVGMAKNTYNPSLSSFLSKATRTVNPSPSIRA